MTKKVIFVVVTLLYVATAYAQSPAAFKTVTVTENTANTVGLRVGCPANTTGGTSQCRGIIESGPHRLYDIAPAVTTNTLYQLAGALYWSGSPVSVGGAIGPGTIGKLAKFTGANTVGDSLVSESGTTVTVNGTLNATTLLGVFNGTAIGVQYGGTGSNLSASGGTNRFLRQNSVGAAVDVVTIASTNLSDTANIAYLPSSNTFSQSNAAGATQTLKNTNAGVAAFTELVVDNDGGTQITRLDAYSSGFTTTDSRFQNGSRLIGFGVGGLSIQGFDATGGDIRFYVRGTVANILFTKDGASGTSPFIRLSSGAYAAGGNYGAKISLGQSTSGSGAPGCIEIYDRTSVFAHGIWVDSTGMARVSAAGTGCPTETTGDLIGTVIGTQVSTRASKNILSDFVSNEEALRTLVNTPVYNFNYKSGAYNGETFTGIVIEDNPLFGMDNGKSFNPITTFGYTVAAIKQLEAEIAALKAAMVK